MKIFLVGNPGAGKSTVGPRIAEMLGSSFFDLDVCVAEAAGQSVAALVQHDLSGFRKLEAAQLAALAHAEGAAVIATGGGAATWGDNLAVMKAAGFVCALTVTLPIALARTEAAPRPLLREPSVAARLWHERAPRYREAHAVIDTGHLALHVVAERVVAAASCWRAANAAALVPNRLVQGQPALAAVVTTSERAYPILIGQTLDEVAPALLATCQGASRVLMVADANTRRYAEQLAAHFADDATPPVLELPVGETHKTPATMLQLVQALLAAGADRRSVVVAVGGGVVGDIAGFAAATALRGIDIIHVPTTLVAMTDSAIGGKTGVDLPAGKNLLGAIWQPRAVLVGLDTLRTLPAQERAAGFGELWKYALLDGAALWQLVDACTGFVFADDGAPLPTALVDVMVRCIAYKAAAVSADERERTGRRILLNLGHTMGHAIETATHFTLAHGACVGLGLLAALRVTRVLVEAGQMAVPPHLTDTPATLGAALGAQEEQLRGALQRSGLPCDLGPYLTHAVAMALAADKKRVANGVDYVVVPAPGACEVVRLPLTELQRILRFPVDC